MDFGPSSLELRRASDIEGDLIERIALLAANWRQGSNFGLRDLPGAYFEHWGRKDDLGILAFDGPWFVGGAYARRVGPADGTYGYVDADLWELVVGVEPEYRGRGYGRLVLESLKAQTLDRGVAGLSLSVERDNAAAAALAAASNFEIVEVVGSNQQMVWRSPLAKL